MGAAVSAAEDCLGAPRVDLVVCVSSDDVAAYIKLFLAHGNSTVLEWRGHRYTVPHARAALCDEAKTEVFKDASFSDRVLVVMRGVDGAKLASVMTCPAFEELGGEGGLWCTEWSNVISEPPASEAPPTRGLHGRPLRPLVDIIACVRTVNATEYIEIFKKHASSGQLRWRGQSCDVPWARCDFCDEAMTEIHRSCESPKRLLIVLRDVNTARMGEVLSSPGFERLVVEGLWSFEWLQHATEAPSAGKSRRCDSMWDDAGPCAVAGCAGPAMRP